MKGALDGGLDIPHSEKRFVGYSAEDKSLDAEVLRKHIYGGHVAEYMEEMQEEAPEKYQVWPLVLADQLWGQAHLQGRLLRMYWCPHSSTHAEANLPAAMRSGRPTGCG